MQTGEIRMRFGRCPYCRAMICRSPDEVVFHCSKCRTPIRGKNPEPTDECGNALNSIDILTADAASVFSDELDACHIRGSALDVDDGFTANSQGIAPAHSSSSPRYGGFRSARQVHSVSNGARSGARHGPVDADEQDELRPLSRRTRRPSSYDASVLRYGLLMPTGPETDEGISSPGNACERRRRRQQQRRRSLLGSQELETATGLSELEQPGVAASPLADPAFHRELLHALDYLRGLVAAIEPATPSSATAAARRGARFFRRLESRLARALPPDEHRPRRNASSTGSSGSSSTERLRKHHCRPVLGGAPFVVCGSCSELLQTPATTLQSRRGAARVRCGGCEQVLELTVPAVAGVACSGRQTTPTLCVPRVPETGSINGGLSGDGSPELLYRVLGYCSPSSLLQSRRY
ncbi:hypothetical protein ACP70R_039749 [Stipagrostis hirtigluma subsp. patula]